MTTGEARSARNCFADGRLDRLALRREDEHWLAARLHDPHTRLLALHGLQHLVTRDDSPRPLHLSPGPLAERVLAEADVSMLLGEDPVEPGAVYLAGALPESASGLAGELATATGGEWRGLRDLGPRLAPLDAGMLCHARALTHWHRRHGYCSDCGARTESVGAGHRRRCTAAACGVLHFPRTDAAVIVLVTHGEGDAQMCLLGRQHGWPPGMYSSLAGFLEPGESLEACVRRELMEEAGVSVHDIRYRSSQPWPFPASLMLGFTARASDTVITLHDDELEEARWFTRAQLLAECRAGRVRLPSAVSIARRLLEEWYEADGERFADLPGAHR